MTNPDIEALAVEQVAKAIHEAHMVEKGPLGAWLWEEAARPFYHNLARAALTALRSTTAEPVAWRYEDEFGSLEYFTDRWPEMAAKGWAEKPLFDRPAPEGLREWLMAQRGNCTGNIDYRNGFDAALQFVSEHLSHPNPTDSAAKDAEIAEAGRFLIERLDEYWNELEDGQSFSQFNGNVTPALARFRAALANRGEARS